MSTIVVVGWLLAWCLLGLCRGLDPLVERRERSQDAVVEIEKFHIRLAGSKYEHPSELLVAVGESATHAKTLLSSSTKRERQGRLAVMLLFTFDWSSPSTERVADRLTYLHCSLSKLHEYIAPYTSIDVFLWVFKDSLPFVPQWLREEFPSVKVLPIPEESWRVPANVGDPATWRFYGPVFPVDYFLMGRWRMTFAPLFVRAMGYRYLLQIDDDSFQLQAIPFDIVRYFDTHRVYLGMRGRSMVETERVLAGLPEFTRYWMVTRNLSHPSQVPGTLFQHTRPRTLDGFTLSKWDRVMHTGNFVVLSMALWFDEVVQDYLQAVLSTGSDIEMRWTEQAVQNIVRLLFLPEKSVYLFAKDAMLHGKPPRSRMDIVQCPQSALSTGFASDYEARANNHKLACQFPFVLWNGSLSEEIVRFKWNCSEFSEYHGVCNVHSNRQRSFDWYLRGFCDAYLPHVDLGVCAQDVLDKANLYCPKTVVALNDTFATGKKKQSEKKKRKKSEL